MPLPLHFVEFRLDQLNNKQTKIVNLLLSKAAFKRNVCQKKFPKKLKWPPFHCQKCVDQRYL